MGRSSRGEQKLQANAFQHRLILVGTRAIQRLLSLNSEEGQAASVWHTIKPYTPMNEVITVVTPVAAAGYSILYMIFGGGLVGAIVIYIIAKIFGK